MLNDLWVEIPTEYRTDFKNRMLINNFKNLNSMSLLILLVEVGLLLIGERMYNVTPIIRAFIIFSLIWIPIIRYVNKRIDVINRKKAIFVQYIYIIGVIWFCLALVFDVINQVDLLHLYLMGIFIILIYIEMSPKSNLVLLVSVYLVFTILLPNYLNDSIRILVLQVNALVFNVLVWIFVRMMYEMRLKVFLDTKLITDKNDVLKDMASRDSMTGLYNHGAAYKYLGYSVEEAKTEGEKLTIIMADIDNFKRINDTHGHQYGDYIIKAIAQVLNKCIRSTDILCRYGGEEFLLILPGAGYEESKRLAERIRSKIENTEFDRGEFITISGGVSVFDGENANDLVKDADSKLYDAKQSGKNRFVFWKNLV
jgi:diguanylate cyclase (GGDEF)-like protein